MDEPSIVFECRDANGRRVVLEAHIWFGKILVDHGPDMEQNQYAVQLTVERPDVVTRDKDFDDHEVYYRRGVLPSLRHRLSEGGRRR